jgi:Flp pilus assembly protein TadG
VQHLRIRQRRADLARDLLRRFAADRSGAYAVVTALLAPVLVGTAALGSETGWWMYLHKNMLSAADSAAVSAATAGVNIVIEANAVTAAYGYVNGVNGVSVAVNQPPTSGNYAKDTQAVEVIVSRPQPRLLTALFGSDPVNIKARAVALGSGGPGCVLALDRTASAAVTIKGTTNLNLIGCNLYDDSNAANALNVSGTATVSAAQVGVVGGVSGTSSITTSNGIRTGMGVVADPYANVSVPPPSGCDYNNKSYKNNVTISPGVYCQGIQVNAGANVTMSPGIYYIDRGSFSVAGNATITGTGVTIVFTSSTSSNWATASISSNANINLTAPSSGPTAGIVLFGDRNTPAGTAFSLTGGGTQNFGGAVYLPTAALSFSGGNGTSTSCTQVIADTITVTGNSNLKVDCGALGGRPIGNVTAQLVE